LFGKLGICTEADILPVADIVTVPKMFNLYGQVQELSINFLKALADTTTILLLLLASSSSSTTSYSYFLLGIL
jgi:hypothetical protein